MKHLLLLLVAVVITASAAGQSGDDRKPSLLVGFYGGINFTSPSVKESYYTVHSLDNVSTSEKNYAPMFQNMGHQFGFVMFYPVAGNLHVGLLPSYASYKYQYDVASTWTNSTGSTLTGNFDHLQRLRYFELPATVRYYVGTARFKPFVEGLFSFGLLHIADKQATIDYSASTGGTSSTVQHNQVNGDFKEAYLTSKWDVGAGAGISYDFDQLILTLGASYMYQLNTISNDKNRYNNGLFANNTYSVEDRLSLNNLKINLSIIFPISKITKRGAVECHYFKEKRK